MPLTPSEFDALIGLIDNLSSVNAQMEDRPRDTDFIRARLQEREAYIAEARAALVQEDDA